MAQSTTKKSVEKGVTVHTTTTINLQKRVIVVERSVTYRRGETPDYSRWILRPCQEALRDGLIKLGWTPPKETP